MIIILFILDIIILFILFHFKHFHNHSTEEAREYGKSHFSLKPVELLPGWECRVTLNGRAYYIDRITHTTTWAKPLSELLYIHFYKLISYRVIFCGIINLIHWRIQIPMKTVYLI